MNGWNNPHFLIALLASNVVALVILFFAWKNQRVARLLLFALFAWAGCFNWYTAAHSPADYLNYADLAFLSFYRSFIRGWFSHNVLWMVGFIATGQLLIAASMWLKGRLFKLGAIGGIIFLVAIIPLGVGSGFPFPIITALAFYLLYKNPSVDYLWKPKGSTTTQIKTTNAATS